MLFGGKDQMVTREQALKGRPERMRVPERHYVNRNPLQGPWPEGMERAIFGLGCFWGAERRFWQLPGVHSTAAGYAGGYTENPTYEEVCSGRTGHAEVVQVVFDPARISYEELLQVFWESHDPTQGMRQGNDLGTQYRSLVHTFGREQQEAAETSRAAYQQALKKAGYRPITTAIAPAGEFYYAEEHHQQYLARNPGGYCGLGGLGIEAPAQGAPFRAE